MSVNTLKKNRVSKTQPSKQPDSLQSDPCPYIFRVYFNCLYCNYLITLAGPRHSVITTSLICKLPHCSVAVGSISPNGQLAERLPKLIQVSPGGQLAKLATENITFWNITPNGHYRVNGNICFIGSL